MKRLLGGISIGALSLTQALNASAAIITYDVNMTFDPNATPSSSLGAAGPGTVTGTITIDTSIPIETINAATQPPGYQITNIISADLTEKSNNGTWLSVFSQSPVQIFNSVTPYNILFLGSPVTEYPNTAYLTTEDSMTYERVFFYSSPIVDSIQVGPSIIFDFPYPAGGSVIPGNFDSQASTGFNAYLYGTVGPQPAGSAPETSTWIMLAIGFLGLGLAARRGAASAAV